MEDLGFYIVTFVALLITSAFFSASETALSSVNKIKIKHRSDRGNLDAYLIQKLIQKPEKVITLILIANNFVNIFTTSLATALAIKFFGDTGIIYATIVLTIIILVFAEILPKTAAAVYPDKLSSVISFIIYPIFVLFKPLVFLLNNFSVFILFLFRIKINGQNNSNSLKLAEIQTVLAESSHLINKKHRKILDNIIELEEIKVSDVMILKKNLVSVDLNANFHEIINQISSTGYRYIPVYESTIDNIIGILDTTNLSSFYLSKTISKDLLKTYLKKVIFLPETNNLLYQLEKFSLDGINIGFVVDEYGEILGMVTLQDIFSKIIGNPSKSKLPYEIGIIQLRDGDVMVNADVNVRTLNRELDYKLPTKGPKTLNGIILEKLEDIPDGNICVKIGDYLIETIGISNNAFIKAKISCLKNKNS